MPGITNAKCVLIIGATAGIGRELALAIHDLDSKPTVIVGGRRQERIDELTQKSERFKDMQIDMTAGRQALAQHVKEIVAEYPELDAVIFSSGVQQLLDFAKPESVDLDVLENELNTNYTSVVTFIKLILPHLLKLSGQGRPSFIVPITSSLSIVPGHWVPNYSATKAALHSLSLSMQAQLKDTNVHIMEILPPLTESELHDHQGTTPRLKKNWMPLDEFIPQAMAGLCRGDLQIPVGDAAKQWETYEKGKLAEMGIAPGRN